MQPSTPSTFTPISDHPESDNVPVIIEPQYSSRSSSPVSDGSYYPPAGLSAQPEPAQSQPSYKTRWKALARPTLSLRPLARRLAASRSSPNVEHTPISPATPSTAASSTFPTTPNDVDAWTSRSRYNSLSVSKSPRDAFTMLPIEPIMPRVIRSFDEESRVQDWTLSLPEVPVSLPGAGKKRRGGSMRVRGVWC